VSRLKRWVFLLIVGAILAAAVSGWWLLREKPQWRAALTERWERALQELGVGAAAETEDLLASGFVEAQEVLVTTAGGGRIVALHGDEGDEVQKGQVLAELDSALLLARIESAEADLTMAEASLALVKAGARQESLDHALAQLAQAQATARATLVSWQDAEAMAQDPQDLELALLAAQARLQVLGYQARQAEAAANAAQAAQDFADAAVGMMEDVEPHTEWIAVGELPPGVPVPEGCKVVMEDGVRKLYASVRISVPADKMTEARYQQATSTYQAWMAWTGAQQAQTAFGGAEEYATLLALQAANPLTLEASANAARAQHEVAAAAVGLAEAQVAGLRMGATPEQIAAAEAQVEIARAALRALQVQADELRLQAPISGLVLERPVQAGELALPGSPLFSLANLDRLSLTVYVPEDRVGRVRLGGEVAVSVDAYPGRTFAGRVTYVSGEAEFTPKNVQTREERVNMVFAVKVELPNPEHLLKPGMPADARLLEAGLVGESEGR
jgi:multidrug efflux pump subunit AcrA (membrane-fusion protein)